MLRKLLALILTLMLVPAACLAEEDAFASLNVPPTGPVVTESEFLRIESVCDAEKNITRSRATLTGSPVFADGSPVTAQDLLFSLYVYLDPGCPAFTDCSIIGLENYALQISEERLTSAAKAISAIRKAGEDHPWKETDGWTQELQNAYWTIWNDYLAACEAEFVNCAQSIADYCGRMLAIDNSSAFMRSSADIAADDGLSVAYAMLQWGYADSSETLLIARHSGKVWNLDETAPVIEDFANELSLAYGGDLRACWAIETTGAYTPVLPDVELQFRDLYLGDEKDSIPSISGIRMIDETTLEIDFSGIHTDGAASLLSRPVLSLNAYGNPELWSPETGLYGHPFGEVPDVETLEGPVLIEYSDEIIF